MIDSLQIAITSTLFIEHYRSLSTISGEPRLLAELRRVLERKELRAVIHDAYQGRVPPRIKLFLFKERVRFVKAAVRGVLLKAKTTAVGRMPRALLKTIGVMEVSRPATPQRKQELKLERDPADFGPVAVLSVEPPIFLTGIAFQSMIGIASAFGKAYGKQTCGFPDLSVLDHRRYSSRRASD